MTADESPQPRAEFRQALRGLVATWLALLLLLAATTAGAFLHLGTGNLWLGLGIAALKIALVLLVFMRFTRTFAFSRVAAFVALFLFTLLASLSSLDVRTRDYDTPAAVQQPAAQPPLRGQHPATR